MTIPTLRFALAALLIASTALFLEAHTGGEVFPPRLLLSGFPQQLDSWRGTDVPIPDDELAILGHGEFLKRAYQNQQARQPFVDLFIAYFPSQRAGDTIHSPQHCWPGAGWTPVERTRTSLAMPGHSSFPVNRYLFAKGDARRLVLYWYWAHDRGVASEYWAKFYLVTDSIRMNRSDGALVTLSTQMYANETAAAAQQRLMPFANTLVPMLNEYIPR